MFAELHSAWSCCNKMCDEGFVESCFKWKSSDRNWVAEDAEAWSHCSTEGLSGQIHYKLMLSI